MRRLQGARPLAARRPPRHVTCSQPCPPVQGRRQVLWRKRLRAHRNGAAHPRRKCPQAHPRGQRLRRPQRPSLLLPVLPRPRLQNTGSQEGTSPCPRRRPRRLLGRSQLLPLRFLCLLRPLKTPRWLRRSPPNLANRVNRRTAAQTPDEVAGAEGVALDLAMNPFRAFFAETHAPARAPRVFQERSQWSSAAPA